ncbi:MAG: AAA family ATPase [Deltaproteobacteria bacterium]|nr:AAA family ATPase [Deltaproteobacteria bacterium]
MSGLSEPLRLVTIVHDGLRSTVFRAIRTSDQCPVILKVLTPACDTAEHRARLLRELSVTARFQHEVIVTAYGSTYHEGRLALVLEDFGGEALHRSLPPRADLARVLEIAIGIARALAVVHRAGIVHRDVKPQNVIYRADTGEVKLTDFGVAVIRGDGQPDTRVAHEGTPAYMAPEQTGRMSQPIDRRADLYGFGVLLYELLAGKLPFEARDALGWMHLHAAQLPRPVADVDPSIPVVISELVHKLLAKAPVDRYQTAEGVEHDLVHALASLQNGEIAPFELAKRDASDEFRLPDRMYGRGHEAAVLNETFARVATLARRQVLQISGYSGIGKTSLVRELVGPVAQRRGYFASGKFDQYRRHLPYSAITQVGNELVRNLLTESTDAIAHWRTTVLQALDGTGRVLVDLIPDIERVLGRQLAAPELPAGAAQNRLHHAVRVFVHAFAHPIVLFLDDMQWADAASLSLLEAVLVHDAPAPLLVVLAHRDPEPDTILPMNALLERVAEAGTPIRALRLEALDFATVRHMVVDTLRHDDATCDALATIAMAKTAGNPFFVREFLRTLQLAGLLRFDPARGAWRFDPAEVEASAITDNVIDLMVGRLQQLPPAGREALRLGAFLGSELLLRDLAEVMGQPEVTVLEGLRVAADGSLVALHELADGTTAARFGHDRIQQAAYALTPEPDKPAVHLRVARLLWSRLDASAWTERLFEIANHFDAAFALVVDPDEREQLLQIFLRAGRRAKATTAYVQASTYLMRAAELLGEAAWVSRFELAFEVHVELSECDYLAGQLERARARFGELLLRAHTDLERARVYYLQIRLFQVAGDMAGAFESCLRAFALLGLEVPETDDDAAREIEHQHRLALELLGDRPVAELLDHPPMTDPRIRMLVDLLEVSGPPVYMVRPALFAWVALQLVNHSLRHGNTEASCYGYGIYALLRAAVVGDVDGGYAFSWLAIRLNEQLGGVKLEGCMLHLLGDHVNFWKNPIASDLPILERGFAACVRGGDHIYSNYIGFQAPWHLYESGAPLGEVRALAVRFAGFALETGYEPVRWTLRAEQQFVSALMGQTEARGALGSGSFDETEALAAIAKANFACGTVYVHILQLVARYTFDQHAAALEAADHAEPQLGAAFSMPMYVTYHLYRTLTLAALYPTVDEPTGARWLEAMRANHRTFVGWADVCPANFADKAALIGAELARVTGDLGAALRGYQQARLAARAQGFVQYEALACELAAAVYGTLGVDFVKRILLADAYALYVRWGAAGKAADLLRRNRGLIHGTATAGIDGSTGSTPATTGEELDFSSVIKAAQSVSAEIVLPRLLPRLMSIVIEYAGAQRGSLLLVEGEVLEVAAEAAIDHRSEAVALQVAAAGGAVPASVVQYVQHTAELVVIEDASVNNPFGADVYFQHGRHRSVLCKPIQRQGRLVGMFYLENDLVAGAFGPARLATLEVLASQTAISVENSRLYEESQAAVVARDEFLALASHELRTPLAPLAMQVHRLGDAVREGGLRAMSDAALLKLATTCETQIFRLDRVIRSLLEVSRIASGTLALCREQVDLCALVADVASTHADLASSAGCAVSLRCDQPVIGSWDRLALEQVIDNLVRNAIKFGRGQPIELRVSAEQVDSQLEVIDRGAGIVAAERTRIFQRFERIPSVFNVDGLGLGLFIVRSLVEAHGGDVKISDTPGGGATFRVRLPNA